MHWRRVLSRTVKYGYSAPESTRGLQRVNGGFDIAHCRHPRREDDRLAQAGDVSEVWEVRYLA